MIRFPWPEPGPYRRIVALAVLVTVSTALLLAHRYGNITLRIGDTDDAMRIVLVRDLLHGRGWYDQLVTRLQPPQGAWMHWSRLVDGGLAGFDWLLGRFLPAARAEWAMRFFWPLAWILPATLAALVAARIVGTKGAAPLAALLLALDQLPYIQFLPGRIDHHNLQITLVLVALACGLARRRDALFAALAALATAVGLAIGIEALVFHAVIGTAFALRFAFDRTSSRPALAYGAGLALGTIGVFCLQTPPARWGLPQCDSMGLNLVAGLAAAGFGLAAAVVLTKSRAWPVRLAAVAAAGLVAAVVYVGLEPICLKGPFALVDPRVGPFWLDRIQELRTLPAQFAWDRHAALRFVVLGVMALAASAWLLWDARPRPSWRLGLLVALVCASLAIGYGALRMETYAYWFGLVIIAVAAARLFEVRLRSAMIPSVLVTALLAPVFVTLAVDVVANEAAPLKPGPHWPRDQCFDIASYARLKTLPPGLVLAGIDEGPHILANTPHSVIAASYHRMWASNLAAHQAFDAPPDKAEAAVRALHPDYVVDCYRIDQKLDPASFGERLRQGVVPPWLEPLSAPSDVLRVYRVRPPKPAG
ncbi:MAG TPA: hypothetical protein VG939_19025 [Caulobacteraceae bacterium]|nr:hypothetical protein [Caulobacteraceae bacterium]